MTSADWITTTVAAGRLNVSERTVLRMASNGILRARRWGSGLVRPQYRIDPASVSAFLDGAHHNANNANTAKALKNR